MSDKDNGDFVGHFSCIADELPNKKSCSSSDGLAVYQHKGDKDIHYDGFCWSCNQFFTSEDVHRSSISGELGIENGVVTDSKKVSVKPKKEAMTTEQVIAFIKSVGYQSGNYRGIPDEYSQFYGHLTKVDNQGKVLARFYPETEEDKVVGYKSRIHPKDFGKLNQGRTGIKSQLSGQVKFKAGGKYLLIVGGECYSKDTEVLTNSGWKFISDLLEDDKVFQVENGLGDFVTPLEKVKKWYEGDLLNYSSSQIDLLVTPNHKMVSLDYKKREYFHLAKDKPKSGGDLYRKCAVSDKPDFEGLSDNQIRFIVAFSADSKVDTRKSGKRVAHFGLIKDRKIERLQWLLKDLNMNFTQYDKETHEWQCGRKYHTFNVTLEDWVPVKGIPVEWVENLSLRQKLLVLEELILWDGNYVKNRNAFEFSTKRLEEVEIVQALAVTSGLHAKARKRKNSLGEWYCVLISRSKSTASYQSVEYIQVPYKDYVYCVTVPKGQLLVRRNGKVVVCGNCDKAAAFGMLRESQKKRGQQEFEPIAVVSPTTGEGSAAKQVAAQYDFCNGFDHIIVGMDNDSKGHEATAAIVKVLPAEKVKIATWTGKDPNKMLQDGKQDQFVRDFYNAKPYLADGVITSVEADESIEEELARPKIKLPEFMRVLQNKMAGGIPLGYWVNWIAMTGVGKSTTVNEAIREWVYNSPYKVGILSLELTDAQYMIAMLSREVGAKINLIENPEEAVAFVQQPEVQLARTHLRENDFGEERFVILDDREGSLEHTKKQIEKLIKKHGCQLIVIDPINDLFDGVGYEEQAAFIKWMKAIVKTGVTFSCVCHVRKSNNSTDKNGKRIVRELTEDDVSGLSLITKSAGANIFLNRDKYAEDVIEQNTTKVTMGKCRWTGITGNAGSWFYDNKTHTMYDFDTYFSKESEGIPVEYSSYEEQEIDIADIL